MWKGGGYKRVFDDSNVSLIIERNTKKGVAIC